MWLGKWRNRNDELFNISWPKVPVKIVGIFFSYDNERAYHDNITAPFKSINRLLNHWHARGLTLLGKMQVIKTLIIPKFLYIFNLINVKIGDLKKISGIIHHFIWKGPDRVSRNSLIGNIQEGGLGMIDIFALYKAFKISWIKRYISADCNHPWKLIFDFFLGPIGGEIIFKCNYQVSLLPVKLPDFYRELLNC